jgi:cytoskeletal protein RodZ
VNAYSGYHDRKLSSSGGQMGSTLLIVVVIVVAVAAWLWKRGKPPTP